MRYSIPVNISNLLENFFELAKSSFTDRRDMLDFQDAIKLCTNEDSLPLLTDIELYRAHEEAFLLMPILKERLIFAERIFEECLNIDYAFLNTESFSEYDYPSRWKEFTSLWSNGDSIDDEDFYVFSGLYMLSAYGKDLFTIDFKQYGFESFELLVFYGGAYLSSKSKRRYDRNDFAWVSTLNNGEVLRNCFSCYVHGDFRFVQCKINSDPVKSPFGDLVTIKKEKVRTIAAYHSTECMFLVTVLRYAIESGVKPVAYQDYKKYTSELLENGQYFGNYSDAGSKSFYSEVALLDYPLSGIIVDDKVRHMHGMPKEESGWESASVVEGNLVFFPSGVKFGISDIDNLIHGLHIYCQNGSCRTTVGNLMELYEHISPENKYALGATELVAAA